MFVVKKRQQINIKATKNNNIIQKKTTKKCLIILSIKIHKLTCMCMTLPCKWVFILVLNTYTLKIYSFVYFITHTDTTVLKVNGQFVWTLT